MEIGHRQVLPSSAGPVQKWAGLAGPLLGPLGEFVTGEKLLRELLEISMESSLNILKEIN